jgi:hypothetical protein
MLTPNQLERASSAFRRGYNDRVRGKEVQLTADECLPGTFNHTDYMDGYEAAGIDLRPLRR